MMQLIDMSQSWAKMISDKIKLTKKEEYIKKRLDICSECEHLNVRWNKCSICGCPIIAKVYSKNGCPLKKW